jgi:hypothetical protein
MHTYECVLKIEVNPVRQATSQEEFISNLIDEYNERCRDLFFICRADITDITSNEEKD